MKREQVYIAVVMLFLGLMVAVQLRSTQVAPEKDLTAARVRELTSRLNEVSNERDDLLQQVKDLQGKLEQVSSDKEGIANKALREELYRARMEAGLTPVKGPGVQVTLDDSPRELSPGEDPNLYILHEEDLLKVVNELRAGGAEAISINGQRILATSEIRCAGNTILVNTKRVVPPLIILATGDPKTMKSGLEIKGGIFEQLKFWGLIAQVEIKDEVVIPAYAGSVTFAYTKPVKEGE